MAKPRILAISTITACWIAMLHRPISSGSAIAAAANSAPNRPRSASMRTFKLEEALWLIYVWLYGLIQVFELRPRTERASETLADCPIMESGLDPLPARTTHTSPQIWIGQEP